MIERQSARVLLLDAQDRLLLLHGGDPSDPGRGSWWFTVGGGVDEGEDLVTAAARELWEEAGLRCDPADLGEPVHEEVSVFTYGGRDITQTNTFFALRVDAHEVDLAGLDAFEQQAIDGHRWWSLEELRATAEPVYPRRLLEILERL